MLGFLLAGCVKPKFYYADFHRNFPAGKVVDTNHESRGHKPSRHVKMFATKSVTSPWQTRLCRCNGIRSVTMHGVKSATKSAFVADTNHESPCRDLCCGLSWFVLSRTLSQSRCNGIWASARRQMFDLGVSAPSPTPQKRLVAWTLMLPLNMTDDWKTDRFNCGAFRIIF